jgi:hypothetical protein
MFILFYIRLCNFPFYKSFVRETAITSVSQNEETEAQSLFPQLQDKAECATGDRPSALPSHGLPAFTTPGNIKSIYHFVGDTYAG